MSRVENNAENAQGKQPELVQLESAPCCYAYKGLKRDPVIAARVRAKSREIVREIDRRRLQEIRGISEGIDNQTTDESTS